MFSLRDLCFVFCSRDLDVLRAQRIMGFYLDYHKSTRSENPITWLALTNHDFVHRTLSEHTLHSQSLRTVLRLLQQSAFHHVFQHFFIWLSGVGLGCQCSHLPQYHSIRPSYKNQPCPISFECAYGSEDLTKRTLEKMKMQWYFGDLDLEILKLVTTCSPPPHTPPKRNNNNNSYNYHNYKMRAWARDCEVGGLVIDCLDKEWAIPKKCACACACARWADLSLAVACWAME